MKQLKVLELFAGTRSIGKEFDKKGHLVYSVELDRQHENIDWYGDINVITADEIIERMGGLPDVIWASPPCFTEETLVLTDCGYKKIKDISVGDKVITHTNTYNEVLNIGRKLTNKINKIKISTSEEINTTDDHPFYARTKCRVWNNDKRGWDRKYGEPEWIKAKDLDKNKHMVGFAINTESKIPVWKGVNKTVKNQINSHIYNENKISNYFENGDFWWLIGRYIGDGWTRHTENRFEFYICCAKNELTEITGVLDRLDNNFFNYSVVEQKSTYKISVYKKELVEYVSQFGKYAHGKKLTGDIINLPKTLLRSFLDGYFSADGYRKIDDSGKETFTASSVSRELIHGIGQCIAKVYNIPFSITKFCKNGFDIIEERKVKVKDIYILKYNLNNKKSYSFIENGILWTNIKSIKESYEEVFVYNIEVKNDNSYTANGVIVHNCEKFSVAAIGRHWIKGTNLPKTEDTKEALALLERTVKLIKELNPKYFFIENPRGKMRKMDCMQEFDRYTVTYCLGGETEVITRDGVFEIKDLVGTTPELLTKDGEWIAAPIRNYGKQKLMKITLSRAKKNKVIYATENHRWLLGNKIKETKDLKKGDRLDYVKTNVIDCEIVDEYVARGFCFGDGYILNSKPKGFAMFCGEKQEMLKYFDGIGGKRWRDDKENLEITKLYGYPKEWKTQIPSVYDDASNIYSWLAGYIASDGTVSKTSGQVTISSSSKSNLESVRDLCRTIGIDTYSIVEYWRKGYGEVETPIYQITLMKSDITEKIILRSKHKESFVKSGKPKHQARKWSVVSVEMTDRFEDVYCAEVEGTHCFALNDGILTHNCQYGDERMKPTDLWTSHPNPKFKPPCKNGDPCHIAAPRGSQTGTQGIKTYKDRSRIPEQLCNHVANICEEGFEDIINIEYIVEELIRVAKDSTSEGNWIYEKNEIEEMYDIKLNKLIIERIKELLEENEDVADVQLYDDCIDIMLYQDSF